MAWGMGQSAWRLGRIIQIGKVIFRQKYQILTSIALN